MLSENHCETFRFIQTVSIDYGQTLFRLGHQTGGLLEPRTLATPNLIHIHGNKDIIFPIENINDCIVVEGGTHIMILNKYKWLNENLPKLY